MKGQRSRLSQCLRLGLPAHRHGREDIDQQYSGAMSEVTRLFTVIDLDDRDSRGRSVRARHEAELADGRRFVLLDDRGWSSSAPVDDRTTKEVESTARTVVGPDEPRGDQTRAAVEEAHWNSLQHKLEDVDAEEAELRTLPHDVEVSERLRRRLVGSAPD
jgi:hypothetical protein